MGWPVQTLRLYRMFIRMDIILFEILISWTLCFLITKSGLVY